MFLLYSSLIVVYLPVCFSFRVNDGVTYAEKVTFAHNYVRDLHLVGGLVWDAEMAQESQEYSIHLAEINSLEHSVGSKRGFFGENLYKGFDGFKSTKTIAEAVYYWYLEINGYDFKDPSPDLEVFGHFTELTWRSTARVGCGYTTAQLYGGLMTYIVCRYRPGGNLEGLFLQNILPLSEGAAIPNSPNQLQAPIGCIDTYNECMNWIGVCRQAVFKDLMLRYCKKTCNIC